jgi:hypothetical protein
LGKCRKPDLSSLDAKALTARNGKLLKKDAKLFAKRSFGVIDDKDANKFSSI